MLPLCYMPAVLSVRHQPHLAQSVDLHLLLVPLAPHPTQEVRGVRACECM